MQTYCMIDLETLSIKMDSSIVSIGAVLFNLENDDTYEFYSAVDLQSCIDLGMSIDGDTISWWMKQSEEARKVFDSEYKLPIGKVLEEFSSFLSKRSYSDTIFMGNSSRFDLGILINAYNLLKMKVPWDYPQEGCYRTLKLAFPNIRGDSRGVGVKHNALSDAIRQAAHCKKILQHIGGIK